MAEARYLIFCIHTEGGGPNEKPCSSRSYADLYLGQVNYFCNSLHILGTAIVIEPNACSVSSTFNAAFAKSLWPHIIILGQDTGCKLQPVDHSFSMIVVLEPYLGYE